MPVQLPTDVKPHRRGRPPRTPVDDRRPEILKLSSGWVRTATKPEDTCLVCEQGDGTLLHCNGPCLQVFHVKCIGLTAAPSSRTFTCSECLTGMDITLYLGGIQLTESGFGFVLKFVSDSVKKCICSASVAPCDRVD